jgi:hypothetical protein
MLQRNIIPTKKFIRYVKNTINDLKGQRYENIKFLRELIRTNNVSLFGAVTLYEIIEIRKEHIQYIAKVQDKQSFNIVNKEHYYMEKFLDAHFINGLEIYGNHICGCVSYKEVI